MLKMGGTHAEAGGVSGYGVRLTRRILDLAPQAAEFLQVRACASGPVQCTGGLS